MFVLQSSHQTEMLWTAMLQTEYFILRCLRLKCFIHSISTIRTFRLGLLDSDFSTRIIRTVIRPPFAIAFSHRRQRGRCVTEKNVYKANSAVGYEKRDCLLPLNLHSNLQCRFYIQIASMAPSAAKGHFLLSLSSHQPQTD